MSFFVFETYENAIFSGFAKLASFFGVEQIAVIFLGSLEICVILVGY